MTNVSYRRFKQSDVLNDSFIIEILSFIVQNFAPIILDRKLDDEKEKRIVKYLWDECIPHDFTRFIYKKDIFLVVSSPKLTYQKADGVVKEFIKENPNRINHLKYKTEKNFKLIHYVYSLLLPKIYNRVNDFGIRNKSNFDFVSWSWRVKKQNGAVAPKIVNELPTLTKQILVTDVLATPKSPEDYKNREVHELEQKPVYFEPDPPIAPAPKYRKLVTETVEVKHQSGTDRADGKKNDGSAKKNMDPRAAKKKRGKKTYS